jgi:transglutaminase-like putative cysteine protease
MRLDVAPTTQLLNIPNGAAGTRETLKAMARIVRQFRIDPYFTAEAAHIVAMNAPGAYRGEIDAIHAFVRDQIRYLQDPVDIQALRAPDVTVRMSAGNCAQKSILAATLLEAINHKCRFVAVGYTGNPQDFEHVYVETKIGVDWLPIETTLHVPSGWAPVPPDVPDRVTAYMV